MIQLHKTVKQTIESQLNLNAAYNNFKSHQKEEF